MEIEIEPSIQPIIELGNDLSSSTNNQQNSSEFPLEYIPKIDLPNLAPLNTTNTTQFEKIIISCFSNLYGDFGLSRKDAENILSKFVKTLILPLLSHTENLILPLLNTADKIKMCSEFKYIRDIFAELGTYYLFVKYLESKNLYKGPNIHEINKTIGPVISNNVPVLDEIVAYECVMPIEFQIKKFFELPNVFNETLKYMKFVESQPNISSVLHSTQWKEKIKNREGQTILPIDFFFDECEIDNSLGSHAGQHSLANMYYNFPVIPKQFLSLLENIFPALVYESKNKLHGNGLIFQRLVDVMINLEENGIEICIDSKMYTVYFIVHVITGDNAGLNQILGFVRSFSGNHYCRTCNCEKLICKNQCKEDPNCIRTIIAYNTALENEADIENLVSTTGIREISVFNQIKSFHVVENFALDLMHDLHEGVCGYVLSKVLSHFIGKYFSVDELNVRKESFNYDYAEIGNLSKPINLKHLKEGKISMNAREMWTFCHFIPLMIGDKIPYEDEYWKLVCYLIQIMDIILLPEFDEKLLNELEKKIEIHHNQYIKLFGDLKPKFHNLVHYPNMIRKIGPPKIYSTYRFEAKHRNIIEYTKNTNSRLNIAKSVGIKLALNFSNRLINERGFTFEIQKFKTTSEDILQNKHYFNNLEINGILAIDEKLNFYNYLPR